MWSAAPEDEDWPVLSPLCFCLCCMLLVLLPLVLEAGC